MSVLEFLSFDYNCESPSLFGPSSALRPLTKAQESIVIPYSVTSFMTQVRVESLETCFIPPPSTWIAQCHRHVQEVREEVDGYFLEHWRFFKEEHTKDSSVLAYQEEMLKAAFKKTDLSGFMCLSFPSVRDDRIRYACMLVTYFFLIDGITSPLGCTHRPTHEGLFISRILTPFPRFARRHVFQGRC